MKYDLNTRLDKRSRLDIKLYIVINIYIFIYRYELKLYIITTYIFIDTTRSLIKYHIGGFTPEKANIIKVAC